MIKAIKKYQKYIKYLEKNNLSEELIIKNKLIIYFMILGYFSYKNDIPINNQKETLKDITSTINSIIEENINFFVTNNHYDSFNRIIDNITNSKLIDLFSKEDIKLFFNAGYDYAKYLLKSSGIIDYLSGNYARKEEKILKYIYK